MRQPRQTSSWIPPVNLCGIRFFPQRAALDVAEPSRVVGVRWRAVGAEDAPGDTILRGRKRLAKNWERVFQTATGESCRLAQWAAWLRVGFGQGLLYRFNIEDTKRDRRHGDFEKVAAF